MVRESRRMQRGTSLAFALLFAAAVVVVVLQTRPPAAGTAIASASAEPIAPPVAEPLAENTSASAASEPDAAAPASGGDADIEGPELPAGAPKTVAFGVVLVTYAGAQLAPEKARTKQQAEALAGQLLELAKKDFAAAVKKGDRGSMEDAGTIPRGVLEPILEQALFTLEKGAVHGEALDTPRGYWIVRRRE